MIDQYDVKRIEDEVVKFLSRPMMDVYGCSTVAVVAFAITDVCPWAYRSEIEKVLSSMRSEGKLVSWASRSTDGKRAHRVWGIPGPDRMTLGAH